MQEYAHELRSCRGAVLFPFRWCWYPLRMKARARAHTHTHKHCWATHMRSYTAMPLCGGRGCTPRTQRCLHSQAPAQGCRHPHGHMPLRHPPAGTQASMRARVLAFVRVCARMLAWRLAHEHESADVSACLHSWPTTRTHPHTRASMFLARSRHAHTRSHTPARTTWAIFSHTHARAPATTTRLVCSISHKHTRLHEPQKLSALSHKHTPA